MIIRPVKAEEERSSSIPSLGNKRGHGGGGSGARGHRGRGLHRGESSSHASGGYRKGKGSKALLPTVQLSPRQRERALGLLAVDVEDEEGEDVHNVGAERMSRMMLAQDDVRFVSFRQGLSPALAGLSCMRSFIHFHAPSFPFLPSLFFLPLLSFTFYSIAAHIREPSFRKQILALLRFLPRSDELIYGGRQRCDHGPYSPDWTLANANPQRTVLAT
jgi:hypothetical protein